jgi:excisionase family DNA binding protein
MPARLMTVDEVAERLRVGAETVRRWLRLGKLKGARLPNKAGWRIHEDDLDRFVDAYMNRDKKSPNEMCHEP